MRHLTMRFKHAICLFLLAFVNVVVWAQDSTSTSVTTTTSTTETSSWYTSPWVWVAGAALFILLLAAILRGNKSKSTTGSSDRVTVTKTVRRDTDNDV